MAVRGVAAPCLHDGMKLPDGLTARPLAMADARAVFEVMAAQEQYDIGTVEIEEADIVGDWQRPSFDVAASTIGVFDGERLVAYGEDGGVGGPPPPGRPPPPPTGQRRVGGEGCNLRGPVHIKKKTQLIVAC